MTNSNPGTINISKKTLIPIGSVAVIISVVVFAVRLQNKAEANELRIKEIRDTYVTKEILDLKFDPVYRALNINIKQ